ncbi:MAG: type II toxin-antitoxin system Phd/YefM family antitoxin [Candidatus Solibacter usitatus]|nr:type II toxin-antitoxin system Phd/YefM family antitoxin [Candidatus Solibacter usitatus]
MPKSAKKTRKGTWSVQDAKAHFSEVLRLAETSGPQTITRHGVETVVIVRSSEFEKKKPPPSLLDILQACPVRGEDWDITRDKSLPREIDL